MRSTRLIMVAAIAALSASAPAQTEQAACERLRSLRIGSSRILNAVYSEGARKAARSASIFR